MTALSSYSTGTISVSADGTTVTASSALWLTNVKPGDLFQSGHFCVPITDITDEMHLTITPWPGATVSGAAYSIWKVSQQRIVGETYAQAVDNLVTALDTTGFFVFVRPSLTEPDPSLGDDGQYAFQPTTGKTWVKAAGIWTYLGIYKGMQFRGVYDNAATYSLGDVQTTSGTSYVYINATPSAGHTAPNAPYWQVLASIGNTGATGATGASYSGTSTTSLLIGTGSKAFTTQAGLAYTSGARVRASSAANTSNWMEGLATYSGTTLTINVDKTNGSGTLADWNFNIAGVPGAGDLSSANNLSDLANVATARTNLGIHEIDVSVFGAIGDDSTPCQTAFDNAIAALPASGGKVLVPPGIFRVVSVTVPAGVILQGSGRYATDIRTTSASADAIVLSGQGSVINDCHVTSSVIASLRTGTGIKITGSVLAGAHRCRVDGHDYGIWTQGPATEISYCLVAGCNLDGIFLDGSVSNMNETSVVECQSNGNGGCGFRAIAGGASGTAGLWFYRPTAVGNAGDGMAFEDGVSDVYITAPELSTNGGINLNTANNAVCYSFSVSGGLFETSTQQAIWIGPNVSGFTVSGATIGTTGPAGIVSQGKDVSITGNVFGGSINSAINVTSGSAGHVITGNRVSNNFGGTPTNGLIIDVGAGALSLDGNDLSGATTPLFGNIPAGSAVGKNKGLLDYIPATVVSGSAVALTTNVPANVTSINLPAGEWDVSGTVYFNIASGTTLNVLLASISTASAALDTAPGHFQIIDFPGTAFGTATYSIPQPATRISVSAPTPVYLVTQATFGTSALSAFGAIRAVRA